jgi:hypothetical protein
MILRFPPRRLSAVFVVQADGGCWRAGYDA